jgi:hypothetical protein
MDIENKEPEQKPEDKKIQVDLAPGVSIELPYEAAKKVIEKRDTLTKGYKELEVRLKDIETAKQKAEERAKLAELSKAGDMEALKAEASREYRERVDKIQNRIVSKEIETALLADESFLKDSLPDALKLLKADFQFSVDEAGEKVVTADGKAVGDVVKEWLGSKKIFQKAPVATGTGGGKPGPGRPPKTQDADMTKGMAKMFNI